MITKQGIGVSAGVAVGPALILGGNDLRISNRFIAPEMVELELARLHGGLDHACNEIAENARVAAEKLGMEYAAIFSAHLALARDKKLIGQMEELVRDQFFSPEQAARTVLRRSARELKKLKNPYLAERAVDLGDLERNLIRHLLGEERTDLTRITEPVVILAHNLTPSETAMLDRRLIKGFATEVGGPTSHTAILAGALEIPAVVGLGSFLSDINPGETIIVSGTNGLLYIDPDEATIVEHQRLAEVGRKKARKLISLSEQPCETACGQRIMVYGNIEFPDEAQHCREIGADGIGLYRTEFLYLRANQDCTEEEHYEAYRKVLDTFPTQPVVIRTVDLGADKIPGHLQDVFSDFENPELGLRSIRVSLADRKLFEKQLRAILRASVHGDVRIMFPLISSLGELRQAKMILRDVCEDLTEAGVPFRADMPTGMMVEVPSAAIMADEFARESDFFSIGTNDLIQYTLAADRSDPAVAKYYNGADPAIVRTIDRVVQAGKRAGITTTVCGQMCSDPKFVPLLIGLGIERLSVTPQQIPNIKDLVRHLTMDQARDIAYRASQMELARDIETFLRGELKKIYQDEND